MLVALYSYLMASGGGSGPGHDKKFVTVHCSGIGYLPNDQSCGLQWTQEIELSSLLIFPEVVCRLTKSYILAGHRAQTL